MAIPGGQKKEVAQYLPAVYKGCKCNHIGASAMQQPKKRPPKKAQVTVYLTKSQEREIRRRAKAEDCSLGRVVRTLLEGAL